jgi:hypothetical protein
MRFMPVAAIPLADSARKRKAGRITLRQRLSRNIFRNFFAILRSSLNIREFNRDAWPVDNSLGGEGFVFMASPPPLWE